MKEEYDFSQSLFNPYPERLNNQVVTTLLRPSSILPEGICVQKNDALTLFKFTDKLGARLQALLDKKKADTLTPDEMIEL